MNHRSHSIIAYARETGFIEVNVYERLDSPSIGQKRQASSCSGNITIVDQSDVAQSPIASCTSFTGDIILDNASGSISFTTSSNSDFSLSVLDGSVYCRNNVDLQTLSMYGLTTITGSIVIDSADILQEMSAFDLVNVKAIRITNAPQFTSLGLLMKRVETLEIGGTPMTAENTVNSGFVVESFGTLYVHDNFGLTIGARSFPHLQNITESFIFENNGPNSQIFMELIWANNITLRNIQLVELNSMIAVNDSFEISNSVNLTGARFPALSLLGGSFYIQNNPILQGVGWGNLTTIGGSLVVAGNPAMPLPDTVGLQNIASVDLVGSFPPL
jgi:hypothetical protein